MKFVLLVFHFQEVSFQKLNKKKGGRGKQNILAVLEEHPHHISMELEVIQHLPANSVGTQVATEEVLQSLPTERSSKNTEREREPRFHCRHSDCSKNFTTSSARCRHEESVPHSHCSEGCLGCQRAQERRKKRVEERPVATNVSSQPERVTEEEISKTKLHLKLLSKELKEVLSSSRDSEKLAKVRWFNLWWEKRSTEGRSWELRKRVEESRTLICEVFGENDIRKCLVSLVGSEEELVDYLVRNACNGKVLGAIKEETKKENQPTLKASATFVQTEQLSRESWEKIRHFFHLTSDLSHANLEKEFHRRETEDGWGEPEPTGGGRGYCYSLLAYMKWYLRQHPATDDQAVPFKISFDNARITQSYRIKAETGVIEDLRNPTKKHTNGCHFVIWIGSEDRDILLEELKLIAQEIEFLADGGEIDQGNGTKTTVVPFLVCDLSALCKILGLTAVYHPKAHWKCAWCLVTKDEIYNFNQETWSFRDFKSKETKEKGEHAQRLKNPKAYARNNEGIMVSQEGGRKKKKKKKN